ncbi:hypothetical protein [Gluconobacter cerinus]|uniref:hypothetical protein n=1 Tax=Gluconobacter cerinus TaxID=38307 RepID=UPI001B8C42B8|nr:hypothetical protein [Gluconobacter cerinus]MBS1067242.1 hypothetical protein [Gluconobacter cerinus]
MYGIDDPTAVSVMPTLGAAGASGFFTSGNPATGEAATIVTDDWLNGVQSELLNFIDAAGLSPSKSNLNQLAVAGQILGGVRQYSAQFSEAIGGYPLGAVVRDASKTGVLWVSTVAANTTVPGATGAAWRIRPVGGSIIDVATITSSGTYTAPVIDTSVLFHLRGIAAGGGGCYTGAVSAYNAAASGGGSAGAYFDVWLTWAQLFGSSGVSSVPITIGTGGGNTSDGGSTVVGSAINAPGGNGAKSFNSGAYSILSSGADATALCSFPNGTLRTIANIAGQGGGYGITTNPQQGGNYFGFSGAGGSSPFGNGGPSVGAGSSTTGGGNIGANGGIGAGGSGACVNGGSGGVTAGYNGGTGGNGFVLIECVSGWTS